MKKFRVLTLTAVSAALVALAGCTASEDGSTTAGGDEAASTEANKVVTTDSGLKYEVLESGDGATPGPTDTVEVHYRGTLDDGTEFDSSYKRGTPAAFPVNRVIAGWTEALQLMKVGDKWRLTIPPDLAYGSRGAGAAVPPNATLTFEVELLDIK